MIRIISTWMLVSVVLFSIMMGEFNYEYDAENLEMKFFYPLHLIKFIFMDSKMNMAAKIILILLVLPACLLFFLFFGFIKLFIALALWHPFR